MTKYIIKNCPCLYEYGKGDCCNDLRYDQHTLCQDCTDCLLKKIVEKCETHFNFCDNCVGDVNIDCIDCTQGGKAIMGNYILEMLEIKECEE